MIWTNKAYALISLDAYNEAKQTYLNTIPGYLHASIHIKWRTIIQHYQTVSPNLKTALATFHREREHTADNLFNLSLRAALAYMEDLSFLACTTHPDFQLNQAKKNALEEAVLDAMTTCETGKATRFENVLQLYRNDQKNWVTKHLADQRYNLLLQLQGQANQALGIGRGMSIHTLALYMKLAQKKSLGIKMTHSIEDVYMYRERELTKYFDDHYPKAFKEYGKELIANLSSHLIFEITQLFDADKTWEKGRLLIPKERAQEFATYLQNRFGFAEDEEGDALVYSLGEFQDDLEFSLKSKNECLALFQHWMKHKLVSENYLLDTSLVNAENLAHYRHEVTPLYHEELAACAALNQCISELDPNDPQHIHKITSLLQQHDATIQNNIELIPPLFKKYPQLLDEMSTYATNIGFSKQSIISLLDSLLTNPSQKIPAQQTEFLCLCLSDFIVKNPDYFDKLSLKIKKHPRFLKHLIRQNPFFIHHLPTDIKNNETIASWAIEQNPFTYLYLPDALKISYPSILSDLQNWKLNCEKHSRLLTLIRGAKTNKLDLSARVNLNNEEMEREIQCFIQDHAIVSLLTENNLTLSQILAFSLHISPLHLAKIVQWRKKNGKSALAFCPSHSKLFDYVITMQNINYSWNPNSLRFKQQITDPSESALLPPPSLGDDPQLMSTHPNMLADINDTNLWLIAAIRFDHLTRSFKNTHEIKLAFKQLFKIFLKQLLWAALYTLLTLALAFLGGLTFLVYFQQPFFQALLIRIGIGLGALIVSVRFWRVIINEQDIYNLRIIYPYIAIVASLTAVACVFDFIALGLTGGAILFFASVVIGECIHGAFTLTHLTRRLIATFIPFSRETVSVAFSNVVHQACEERILRLQMLPNNAAKTQAAILQLLWHKILAEVAAFPSQDNAADKQTTLSEALDKPYRFFYKGAPCIASFNEIASMPRKDRNQFILPTTTSSQTESRFVPSFFATSRTDNVTSTSVEIEVPSITSNP